jgi:hypothetical protein
VCGSGSGILLGGKTKDTYEHLLDVILNAEVVSLGENIVCWRLDFMGLTIADRSMPLLADDDKTIDSQLRRRKKP